ncbi:MAG: DUF4912 domain-containing protein [Treponema sp.]|jgi:hypothetical protein|nr:DUF4912 domain-containing protein [Treponema sp.]
MTDVSLNLPYLEGLSTAELTGMADSLGLALPPGLERSFIIEELLDAGDDDWPEEPEKQKPPPSKANFGMPALLPQQYNINFIDVLIRDPLWIYAFWEISARDRENHEGAEDFEGYVLRVSGAGASFSVPVEIADSGRYLGFPSLSPAEKQAYTLELCALRGPACPVLAVSRPFSLPALAAPARTNFPAESSFPDLEEYRE